MLVDFPVPDSPSINVAVPIICLRMVIRMGRKETRAHSCALFVPAINKVVSLIYLPLYSRNEPQQRDILFLLDLTPEFSPALPASFSPPVPVGFNDLTKHHFIANKSGDSEFSLDSHKCFIHFWELLAD